MKATSLLRDSLSGFRVRDRVRVQGHDEVFAVLYVNGARTWADLACIRRVGFLTHVPLEKIAHIERD
jgi:hypothetical protein